MKTYLVIFKSGRQDKFFADSIKELKKMCTWENVKDIKIID